MNCVDRYPGPPIPAAGSITDTSRLVVTNTALGNYESLSSVYEYQSYCLDYQQPQSTPMFNYNDIASLIDVFLLFEGLV